MLFFIFATFPTGESAGGTTTDTKTPSPAPTLKPAPALKLFAGNMGGHGNTDGTGAMARFESPYGITTDNAGNIYVTDISNATLRKISPDSMVSTIARSVDSKGNTDSKVVLNNFSPHSVATDNASNIYVADYYRHTILKITPNGTVSTLAGTASVSGSTDATGAVARFKYPISVATDRMDNVYVADRGNHSIRKITPDGVVSTLAGTAGISGSADATGAAARFNYPTSVATDRAGNVYVADTANHTIRKIAPDGMVTTLAGFADTSGSTDATGVAARFNYPFGVASDSKGNVYVADYGNNCIRKITPPGVVNTLSGKAGASCTDSGNSCVRVVSTLAGSAGATGNTDGIGAEARFDRPTSISLDSADNVYVADSVNRTVRKITPNAVVTTLAGTTNTTGSTDALGAAALFNHPSGITTDSAGNIYVADNYNHTIRKITPTGVVNTLAGTAGVSGHIDAAGAAASFIYPSAVATDHAGNVYVADTMGNAVRKITPAGVTSTLANATAGFFHPSGIATDSTGNVYVTDAYQHTIRKIAPSGVITTLAGAAGVSGSIDATGAAARFSSPTGVVTDNADNVYVVDYGNSTIRKITQTGAVTTLAGTAGTYGNIDTTGAAARFYHPTGVTIDSVGNIYVADSGNHSIRKITPAGVVSTFVGSAGKIGFVPGALPGVIAEPTGVAIYGTTLYISMANGIAVVTDLP